YIRSISMTFFALIAAGIVSVLLGLTSEVSLRYLTTINPFYRTRMPLVESVAEHFVPTGSEYFLSYNILLFLGGFGAYLAFKRKSIGLTYALILGILAIYISASFSRLLVYSSIALAALAGSGFKEVTESILKRGVAPAAKKKAKVYEPRVEVKAIYCSMMLLLLTTPLVYPAHNWISAADSPVSIANSGTNFLASLPDWMEALKWMRENTPEDAVFAAWWDYGYWIAVMGNRTSLADNATINSTRIAQLAQMFMSEENKSLTILNQLKADYVIVFVAGEKVRGNGELLYVLGGGGDESKKQWFIRIGGFNTSQYLYEDEFTPRPYFWDHSFLGKLLPFKFYSYIDTKGRLVGGEFKRGYNALYTYEMKYPKGGNGPLELAFISSSLKSEEPGTFAGVIIYRIVR
ncbi:MAG: STT3 domain-containing protein, partial [Nitrososphaerota archaeon]